MARLKSFGYFLQYAALRGILAALHAIPASRRPAATRWLGRRIILNIPGLRRRIAENLALVYPDSSEAERARLLARIAGNIARNMVELLDNGDLIAIAESLIEIPETPALAALREAQAEGRGVLLISGHYGQFDAGRIGLRTCGIEVGAVYRQQNNPWFHRFMIDRLSRAGEPMLPRGRAGMRQLIRHLKGGGAMAILIDQKMGLGQPLDFLGHPAMTSTEAAELALRHNLLVMTGVARRVGEHGFRLEVEGPIPHGDPVEMTRQLNDMLSDHIRRDPTEWYWLHRRWATPKGMRKPRPKSE
ncbi:lysophospholipid acyltransferase family protein [Halovulum sp. GXIMD14794]